MERADQDFIQNWKKQQRWGCWSTMESHMTIRRTARPTAEMETSVPIQYLITSYLAASNWALKVWISWDRLKQNINKKTNIQNAEKLEMGILTRSSLFVRLEVSAFWFVSSSLILLLHHRQDIFKKNHITKKRLVWIEIELILPFFKIQVQPLSCCDFVNLVPAMYIVLVLLHWVYSKSSPIGLFIYI